MYSDQRPRTRADVQNYVFEETKKETGYSGFPRAKDVSVHLNGNRASLDGQHWHDIFQFCVSSIFPRAKLRWVEKFGMCRPILKPVWSEMFPLQDFALIVDIYRYRSVSDLELLEDYRPHPKAKEFSMPSTLHSFGFAEDFNFADVVRPSLMCPSSKHLGLLSLLFNGGSGSSWFDVKPLGVDGSSGGFGWSVS